MRKEKNTSRDFKFSTEPLLALFPVLGIQRRKYQNKKTITYTFLFLWIIMEVTKTKYKMIRVVNAPNN